MENNTPMTSDCAHASVKQTGFWDGMNKETKERTGGPIAKCDACGEEMHLTWDQWNEKYPHAPKLTD